MATEQEELRLTVTLADNASAGLAKLNEEIRQLGSGANQQHIEKFKRETAETTRKVKEMGNEVGDAYKGLGQLRAGLAAGVAGLSLFGYEIARQIKVIVDYADKIRTLNQQARAIGVNPSQLKNVTEQLQAFGISGEAAASSIAAVQGKIAELQRRGSALRADMMAHAPDEQSRRNMTAYLDRLSRASTLAEQLNIIRQGGENIYRETLERTHSTQRAAAVRNEFWAKQGYNALLQNAGKLQELSKEEQRIADERAARAEALSNQLGSMARKWNDMVEASNQPMLQNMKAVLEWAEPKLDKLKAFMEWMQKNDIQIEPGAKVEPLPPEQGPQGWLRRFGDWWRGPEKSFDELQKSLDEHNKTIKELNDAIKGGPGGFQPTGLGGGGFGGGGVIPASLGGPALGGGGRGRGWGGGGYTNLEAGGGAAPYGSSVGAGTGAGAGATPAAGGGGGGASSTKGPMTLGKGDDPRGLEQYIREAAKREGVDPDTAVRVAKSEGLRDFLGDRGKSGGAFQLYTGGGLGNEFQKETGLNPLDPANEKATIDWAMKKVPKTGWGPWHGAKRVGVGPREGLPGGTPPNGQTAGPGVGAGAGETTYAGGSRTYERRRGERGEFNYAATGAFGGPGENLTTITLKNGQKVTVNANVADRYKAFTDELIESGYPLDVRGGGGYAPRSKRGGGGLSMHAYGAALDINPAKNPMGGRTTDMPPDVEERAWRHGLSWGGRFGDPMHFEPMSPEAWESKKRILASRQQLDKSTVAATKVEGTGKISVDVNAPKGTNVGAEGGGLFKKVEISRQTQMSEAKRGPAGGYATEQFLQ
jgi:hypothetical protein